MVWRSAGADRGKCFGCPRFVVGSARRRFFLQVYEDAGPCDHETRVEV